MSRVYVTVSLEDVDTSDLIDELENRYLTEREIGWVIELIKVIL